MFVNTIGIKLFAIALMGVAICYHGYTRDLLIVSEAIDDHIEPISDTFNLLYIRII